MLHADTALEAGHDRIFMFFMQPSRVLLGFSLLLSAV
jgi:hypothetical protein